MTIIKAYFQKILSLLRIRAVAAGLEISDQVLRIVWADKGGWRMEAVRMAPGILEKGRIKDAAAFATALGELMARIAPGRRKKKMNVVVSFSSVSIYSQTFTLPAMEGKDMDKAIDLNVQMASPVDIKQAYFGWQVLGHDANNLRSEVSAAFVDKATVDEMTQALYASGFVTVSVESRALALARILRDESSEVDVKSPLLLINIDNIGIDFLIVRQGKLYFEYANLWTDIADEKGEIAVERFRTILESSLRQVTNFYSQHWSDALGSVVLSAAAFGDEAQAAIADVLALPVQPLVFAVGQQTIPPEWFVAFGCALRGANASGVSDEINLSGSGAMDTFYEEQFAGFLMLWQILVPAVLLFLVAILVVADYFLTGTKQNIESQPAFTQHGAVMQEAAALTASSTAFNDEVALVASTESRIGTSYRLIADIGALASANNITLGHIAFQSPSSPVLVSGDAGSANDIVAFKNALQGDPHIGGVTLSLADIQQDNAGGYRFSLTVSLSSTPF